MEKHSPTSRTRTFAPCEKDTQNVNISGCFKKKKKKKKTIKIQVTIKATELDANILQV